MAKGLDIPVRPGPDGRAVMIEGSEQTAKIIRLAIADLSSSNPFQPDGISDRFVFSVPDSKTIADIAAHLKDAFNRLSAQGRARLVSGSPKFTTDPATQELVVDISYIDLEATKEGEVKTISDRFGVDTPGILVRR